MQTACKIYICQRAPKGRLHEDPSTSGVRVGFFEFFCPSPHEATGLPSAIGDRQPRTIPTKDLPHQVVFGGGVVCELSGPKKNAKYAPPPVLHSRC